MGEFLSLTLHNIVEYLKSQLKLFAISLFILSVGLYFMDISWFILVALAITLIDFIPLIGSALVFVPWIIYEWFWHSPQQAIALLILFLVLEVSQYFLEPFLLGKDLDLPLWLTFLASILSIFLASNFLTIILIPLVLPVIASIKQYLQSHQLSRPKF